MGAIGETFAEVYERERETTLRVLRAVPECELGFRPHERSMSMGQLALHVARLEAWTVHSIGRGGFTISGSPDLPPEPHATADILRVIEEGHADRMATIRGWSDGRLMEEVAIRGPDGRVYFAAPAIEHLRTVLLHHTIHHRGQLTVLIRLTGHRVPSTYGPSADDPGPLGAPGPEA